MTRKSIIATVALLLASLVSVSACAGIIAHNETLRYKMTVTMETPEGDMVGSSVKEAVKHTEKSILPEQGGTFYNVSIGEAVVVDLGARGKAFVLQSSQYEAETAFKLLGDGMPTSQQVPLQLVQYPEVAFFKDLNVPSTVGLAFMVQYSDNGPARVRKCCRVTDDLPNIFGKSVAIKSITIEKTTEPVAWKIDSILPWLQSVKMTSLNGTNVTSSSSLYDRLDGSYFQIGKK